MGVYDRQIAQATRQIKAKGEPVVWNIGLAPIANDPDKPWIVANDVPTTQNVSILFPSGSSNSLAKLIAGKNVEAGKLNGIMHAVNFVPSMSDTVTRSDGTTLGLSSIEPLAPNGQAILWYLEFKL
jgi:hypothetical protein